MGIHDMRKVIDLSIRTLLVALAVGCTVSTGDNSDESLAEQSLDQAAQPLFGIGEKDLLDCNATQESDIRIAQNTIANNWSSYESFVENETGLNIGDCLQRRFQDNGKTHCDWEHRHGCESGLYGHAAFSSQTAHLCRNFLREVAAKSSGVNRRASYAALMAHEWGHTCWRNEANADRIDVATFNWYKSRYAVTDSTCISC
jgi:hypothetical protein